MLLHNDISELIKYLFKIVKMNKNIGNSCKKFLYRFKLKPLRENFQHFPLIFRN
jgi:hypothetical protein